MQFRGRPTGRVAGTSYGRAAAPPGALSSSSRAVRRLDTGPIAGVDPVERKTPAVSLGVPLAWPQRSGGQAPEADALSTELQARGRRSYRSSVGDAAPGRRVHQARELLGVQHGAGLIPVRREDPRKVDV